VSGNRQQGGSPALLLPGSPIVPRSRALLAVRAAALLRLCVAIAVVVAVPLCAALCSSFSCSSFAIIYLTSAYALSVFAQEASDGLLKHFVISLYTRWRTAGHLLRSPTGCVCGGSRLARHTHGSHLRFFFSFSRLDISVCPFAIFVCAFACVLVECENHVGNRPWTMLFGEVRL
jgi:hypothetical protein